jgi:hypothetical protein
MCETKAEQLPSGAGGAASGKSQLVTFKKWFGIHALLGASLAMGGAVINCPSPLDVLKDTYDHSSN